MSNRRQYLIGRFFSSIPTAPEAPVFTGVLA